MISINLSTLNSTQGLIITATIDPGGSVCSVKLIADLNNDTIAEIAVAEPYITPIGRSDAGQAYVIFGNTNLSDINLGSLGSMGFSIYGAQASDNFGFSSKTITAGKFYDNTNNVIAISAPYADPYSRNSAGRTHVINGNFPGGSIVDSLTNSSTISGATASDNAGAALYNLGDYYSNGKTLLIVAAPDEDFNGRTRAGAIYGVAINASLSDTDLSTSSSYQFKIGGAIDFDLSGTSIGSGSFDNTTINLVTAAIYADVNGTRSAAGEVYIFKNIISGDKDLLNFSPSDGIKISGASSPHRIGYSFDACDFTGNGFDDAIIGSEGSGTIYIVPGGPDFFNSDKDLANPATSIKLTGLSNTPHLARCVRNFSGDGTNSLVIGTTNKAYLVYSSNTDVNLLSLTASQGFEMVGFTATPADVDGSIFDINNDGRSDIIIGAVGKAFVLFGQTYAAITSAPSNTPSTLPTAIGTNNPTNIPTQNPTISPNRSSSLSPTLLPSESPTLFPSKTPSLLPSTSPSGTTTLTPTLSPNSNATLFPTTLPTYDPTLNPALSPTDNPTATPSQNPTLFPGRSPSRNPTLFPSLSPNNNSTSFSSISPTNNPTILPSISPVTPNSTPSLIPSLSPSTQTPTIIVVAPATNPTGDDHANSFVTGLLQGLGAFVTFALLSAFAYIVKCRLDGNTTKQCTTKIAIFLGRCLTCGTWKANPNNEEGEADVELKDYEEQHEGSLNVEEIVKTINHAGKQMMEAVTKGLEQNLEDVNQMHSTETPGAISNNFNPIDRPTMGRHSMSDVIEDTLVNDLMGFSAAENGLNDQNTAGLNLEESISNLNLEESISNEANNLDTVGFIELVEAE